MRLQASLYFRQVAPDGCFRVILRYKIRNRFGAFQCNPDGVKIFGGARLQSFGLDYLIEHTVNTMNRILLELNWVDETSNKAFCFVIKHNLASHEIFDNLVGIDSILIE